LVALDASERAAFSLALRSNRRRCAATDFVQGQARLSARLATEQALRDAQFALDVQLHDLRTEFLHRESKLRQDYLDRVAEITAA
jgi:hypothetical protein